jgi:hypothetical protein
MAKMNTWGAPMLTTIKVRGLAGAWRSHAKIVQGM